MEQGQLVADEIVFKMVEERLARPDASSGFILDGFPRTVTQAEALDRMLEQRGERLDRVVLMKVDDEEIVKRITGRRTCAKCGAIFHVVFDPPRQPGRCNACGGELYQRKDDAEETVRMRLRVYLEATRPLVNYYVRSGLLATVDAVGSADEVGRRILGALGCNSGAIPRGAGAAVKAGG
jgi:adenylate kinase